jgi:ribose-phosphate pyrophosphokinase
MIVVGLSNSQKLAKKIARRTKSAFCPVIKNHFPDGEMYLRFLKNVKGQHVVLVQSFQPNPQEAFVEVILAAANARDLGAKKVTLVAPYLGYMRQDKRFNLGEPVSALITAKLIGRYVDRVVTVDPHAHRIPDLGTIFHCAFTALTANRLLAEAIKKHLNADVVIGPDAESYQWAERIADFIKVPVTVFKKTRYSSRRVEVHVVNEIDLRGKQVVITDDIVSTGKTVIQAIKAAKKRGAKSVSCVAVHGVFAEDAYPKLRKAGAAHILTTNTIEKSKNSIIDVSSLIADALR